MSSPLRQILVQSKIRSYESSYVVIATMGNRDEEGLLAVIGTRPKYLGLVASKKKSEALFEYVRTTGATDEDIAVITCPAGIEIGSETLPEIALSVAAEIVRVRRASAEPEAAVENVATDPICGMTVDIATAKYSSVVEGKTSISAVCAARKHSIIHRLRRLAERNEGSLSRDWFWARALRNGLDHRSNSLPFRGTTMLGWVVDQAQRATGLDEVVVVLGRAADQVREQVDFGAARVVENPVFSEGCSSSYRAGIGALNPESSAIMIILGDRPGVTSETNQPAD